MISLERQQTRDRSTAPASGEEHRNTKSSKYNKDTESGTTGMEVAPAGIAEIGSDRKHQKRDRQKFHVTGIISSVQGKSTNQMV